MKALLRFVALGAVLFALRHPRAEPAPAKAWGGDPSGPFVHNDEDLLLAAALHRRLGDDDVIVQRRLMENARLLGLESEMVPSLHLDDGDPIIKRRLVQQMRLQLESEARRAEPTELELRQYLADHPDRFMLPERVRIAHIFFSYARRGEQAERDAKACRVSTAHQPGRDNPDDGPCPPYTTPAHLGALGDPSLWPAELPLQTAADLEKVFGTAAPAISAAPLQQWTGPYRSPWGYHLVRVIDRVAPTMPAFATVRAAVSLALLNERAEQHVEQTLAKLR